MRFMLSLISVLSISAAAHSLTLDTGKFSGVLSENIVTGTCDEDQCNYRLQQLSQVSLKEFAAIKTAEISSLDLQAISPTKWTSGATITDVAGARLKLDLQKLPEDINPGAMAAGNITLYIRDGNSMGVSQRSFPLTCTLISKKQFSCRAYDISEKAPGHQLILDLQVL